MPRKFGSLLFKLFTFVIFGIAGFFALFFANGYQYDIKNQNVKKTSIIDLPIEVKQVAVFFDGNMVSQILPFQVKNVLPGKHDILVHKQGFADWKRNVAVKEDLVTIVSDILLVPTDLSVFNKLLATVESKYKAYFGKDFVVLLEKGGKTLRLFTLASDGMLKDEELDLYRTGIDDLQVLSNNSLLISFNDGVYSWVNLRTRDFKFFSLPLGVEKIRIGRNDQELFFIKEGTLYHIPLYALSLKKAENIKPTVITDSVSQYVLADNGVVFFLSGGRLYRIDVNGQNLFLLGNATDDFENISIAEGWNFSAMILRSKSSKRDLYALNGDNKLYLVSENIVGPVYINGKSQFLYATPYRIYFYDPLLAKKTIVKNVQSEIALLGWFSGDGHFLVKSGNQLYLNDIFDANPHLLMQDTAGITNWFIQDKHFYYLKGLNIYGFNWQINE